VPQIGEYIDAYCSKCKLVLSHVILFKIDGAVSKVKCNTCKAEHKYYPLQPAAKKAAGRKTVARKEKTEKKTSTPKVKINDAPLKWDTKNRNMDASVTIKDYSIHDQYSTEDVINHSVFGLGFVERIVSDKSMDVLFHDSVKLMAMNIA
jgi:uncharacterized Zn finger protein (UPF0148 family)